jgi:hypothetical protein
MLPLTTKVAPSSRHAAAGSSTAVERRWLGLPKGNSRIEVRKLARQTVHQAFSDFFRRRIVPYVEWQYGDMPLPETPTVLNRSRRGRIVRMPQSKSMPSCRPPTICRNRSSRNHAMEKTPVAKLQW